MHQSNSQKTHLDVRREWSPASQCQVLARLVERRRPCHNLASGNKSMLSSLALRTSSATAMRMCVRRGGAHHASSSSSSSSSLRLAVPRRGFADAPRKPSFLGRILWGTQGTEEDQQQQQQQQEQEQQKPLSPETTTKSTVDVSKATSKKADTSAKTTAATSTSNVSSSSTSSEANSNFMNADFEKLGREALEDGTPESENLAKAVSAGAFTMNEFLTVLRKTPKIDDARRQAQRDRRLDSPARSDD
jgi:hypothetical protein